MQHRVARWKNTNRTEPQAGCPRRTKTRANRKRRSEPDAAADRLRVCVPIDNWTRALAERALRGVSKSTPGSIARCVTTAGWPGSVLNARAFGAPSEKLLLQIV